MKRTLLALLATGISVCSFSQTTEQNTDTTSRPKNNPDTIRIGRMVIVRDGKPDGKGTHITMDSRSSRNRHNVSTNWGIVDLGFSNWADNTNYGAAAAQGFVPAGANSETLGLRGGRSRNVNIWIFMQKVNLARHVVNLKYGLGLELNNYFFDDERVRFNRNPTSMVLEESWKNAAKNKLAADYLTVPVMLNFDFTPSRRRGFGLSAGVSAGYLYSSRQKTKIDGKKEKTRDDFSLEPWKFSWIGEVSLGWVRLYGSYAMNNMWRRGLDMTPYTVGIRLSRW